MSATDRQPKFNPQLQNENVAAGRLVVVQQSDAAPVLNLFHDLGLGPDDIQLRLGETGFLDHLHSRVFMGERRKGRRMRAFWRWRNLRMGGQEVGLRPQITNIDIPGLQS